MMKSETQKVNPPIRLGRAGWLIAILVVVGLCIGFLPRFAARRALAVEAQSSDRPVVSVVIPRRSSPELGTPLPAEVEPFIEAAVHARASGYLKYWLVDIGDCVTNGQLLAEIETPELDQQISQAIADLDQAKAALSLAKITADRWVELQKTASVSDQETAEKTADYALKQAAVEAAKANLDRLRQLKDYDSVTANFTGKITRRNTDIGQLITADSGPELFDLAQLDPLRVYVYVPQTLIHAVQPGETAELTFTEMPGRVFTARVTRTAGAVDPASRTLQVELLVNNAKGEILAGSYAQIRFKDLVNASPIYTLEDTTLIYRAQGLQVAVVDDNDRVSLHSVKVGRDYGDVIEILSGVEPGQRVINDPPDSIEDGDYVTVATSVSKASTP